MKEEIFLNNPELGDENLKIKKQSLSDFEIGTSNNINQNRTKELLFIKNKYQKNISILYYIIFYIINFNFLLFQYILLVSFPKRALALSEYYITLYLEGSGYQQQIFSDEYVIDNNSPPNIYINGQKTIIKGNKRISVDDENSRIDIEWTNPPTNLSHMFANLDNIKNITLYNMINTAKTDYSYMFYNCRNLEYFIFNNTGTNNIFQIGDTTKMFYNCLSLTFISFEGNYSIVNINMSYMFYNCQNLDYIYFEREINAKDMREMFYNCYSLESIGDSQFKSTTDSEVNISYYFFNCTNLSSFSNHFALKASDMRYMFYNCKNLNEINLNNLEIVTSANLSYLFYNCRILYNLSWIGILNAPSDTRYMFYNCEKIESINLPFQGISNNASMTKMFYNCISVQNITFTKDSSYFPNDIQNMFYNCSSLLQLSLKNVLHTDFIIDLSYLFYNCLQLNTLEISLSNNLTKNMRGMFQNCKSLESIDLSEFYTTNVEIMLDMFKGCSKLNSLKIDFTKFDTSQVTDMQSMFEDCSNLEVLSLDGLQTPKVQYMNKMFRNCIKLKSLNFTNINTNSIGTMYQMFYNCSSLEYLNLFSIKERGQSIYEMFEKASDTFTFCIEENKYIPNIFESLLKMPNVKRDCSSGCYGTERVNISEKKLCCSYAKYNDTCYEGCPSRTTYNATSKTCEYFNCTNENEYYNFNQTSCTKNITGYYVNDSIAKTIDKCHDDCVKCKGGWSNETTNCTECKSEKQYIYLGNCYQNCSPGYYTKDGKTVCKCFNRKCKSCSEESLEYDLCESCNDDYYQKEIDPTNKDEKGWINCYKDPENYYLVNNEYKQCYESCKYCKEKGTYEQQYCYSCNKNNSFGIISKSFYNCYPNCSSYYYFDNNDIYKCTKDDKCPDDYSKLIHGDRKCVKSCNDTKNVKNAKYEFRGECYELCPTDKSFIGSESDYFCKINCTLDEPFEIVKEQVCRANCTIIQRNQSECITNHNIDRSSDEIQEKIKSNIQEDIVDTFDYNLVNDEKSIVINETNFIYEILTTNYVSDISNIDLSPCIDIFRNYYNIEKDEPLYMLKIEKLSKEIQTSLIAYQVYYPLNGIKLEELDLNLCIGTGVVLSYDKDVLNITNGTEYMFDPNSDYYQDICFPATSEDGADITLNNRMKNYNSKNMSACPQKCVYQYQPGSSKIECICDLQTTVPSASEFKIDRNYLYSFTNIKSLVNFEIMKCYELLLEKDGLISNYGFYMYVPSFIAYVICLLIFFIKEYTMIKLIINEIVESKRRIVYVFKHGNDDLMPSKFVQPAFLNILKFKGIKFSKNLLYTGSNTQKGINNQNNSKINTNKIKRNIMEKNNKEIKEEDEAENNEAENNNDNAFNNNDDIYTGKISQLKNKLNNNNNPPNKNQRNLKEKINLSNKDLSIKKNLMETTGDKSVKKNLDNINIDNLNQDEGMNNIKLLLRYNDTEINNLTYFEALKFDQRTFFEYYISLIKTKHMLICVFQNNDYNSRSIKIFLCFLNFSSCFAINALFFNSSAMDQIYDNKGLYNFIQQLPQIAYSTMISYIIDNIFSFLALSQDDIISVKQEKLIFNIGRKKNEVLRSLHIKFILFFIISLISLIIFWYYISCFCAVYRNTQIHLISDTLISFGTSLLTPFAIYLIPPIFRVNSLKKRSKFNEMIFGFSKILQFF